MSVSTRPTARRAYTLLGWASEMRAFRPLTEGVGHRWVDLGCGPGYVLAELAASFPQVSIIGLDNDVELVRLASAETAAWSGRVRFAAGAAESCPLASKCTDLVVARYLFQHLTDPRRVAREAFRILAPGGRIVVTDIDEELWGVASPQVQRTVGSDAGAHGVGRQVGRGLWRTLADAGFEDVQLDAFVFHSDALGIAAFQEDPRVSRDPEGYVLLAGLMASGTRPKGDLRSAGAVAPRLTSIR